LWLVNKRFSGSLRVLDGTFDPQVYAIALPQGSKLRTLQAPAQPAGTADVYCPQ
jgi:hypothetical protein